MPRERNLDKLAEVVDAINRNKKIDTSDSGILFSLISYSKNYKDLYHAIRNLQSWVQANYNVIVPVVGGGAGCSRITFEIIAATPDDARKFIKSIIYDEEFHQQIRNINFRIIILEEPWTRVDAYRHTIEGGADLAGRLANNDYLESAVQLSKHLKEGIIMAIDNRTNITGQVSNSIINVQSPNATQSISVGTDWAVFIDKMVDKAKNDTTVSKEQYLALEKAFNDLRNELKQPKPKRNIVEGIFTNLGSVASISSLINEIAPFLPKLY